jgi:broad specificity phosphatase PhoE
VTDLIDILLVRHGESESNAGFVTEDAGSALLTPLGERQAEAVAARLTVAPALIVVSPYQRARLTAAPTLAQFPGVPVETWPVEEFTYLAPASYRGSTVRERGPAVEAYWDAADPHRSEGVGAESFADFMARVVETRRRLEQYGRGPIVVFSHKKFINGLLWTWLAGIPSMSARRMTRFRHFDQSMPIRNGACIPVRLGPGAAWIAPVDHSHLSGLVA